MPGMGRAVGRGAGDPPFAIGLWAFYAGARSWERGGCLEWAVLPGAARAPRVVRLAVGLLCKKPKAGVAGLSGMGCAAGRGAGAQPFRMNSVAPFTQGPKWGAARGCLAWAMPLGAVRASCPLR